MIDARRRALAKAASWRIIAIILLAIVTYLTTGNAKTVTLITLIYHTIQTIIFFTHERIWNSISWGKTKGIFIQMTGMSGAGKTTISAAVASKLRKQGFKVELIDGDEYRKNISKDLGFTKEDRVENINRLGFIGNILSRNNVIAIMAAINPYEEVRKKIKENGAFTVYVRCDIMELYLRDTKGLYRRALLPDGHPDKVYNFTGISDTYEEPSNPDLILNTESESLDESVDKLHKFILDKSK